MSDVEIYGPTNCGFCRSAIWLCKKYDMTYTYKNTTYTNFRTELYERLGKPSEEYPQIWIQDKHVGTYNDLLTYTVKMVIEKYG